MPALTDEFRRDLRQIAGIAKAAADDVDYSIDWNLQLESGEGVQTSDWDVPSGLTKGDDGISGTITTCWISGGTVGDTYRVTNTISTTENRTIERGFELTVRALLS